MVDNRNQQKVREIFKESAELVFPVHSVLGRVVSITARGTPV